MKKPKIDFYFEMTDTFGTELNYCWLKRFNVKATSLKSALTKISKETGLNFRNQGNYYKAKNACIGLYLLEFEVDRNWLDKSLKID